MYHTRKTTLLQAFLLLLFFPGHTPQVLVFFLALTSTATLFLVFFLALHFSVVQQGRKKLLYIFKQRKTNTNVLGPCGKVFYSRKMVAFL